MLLLTSNTRKYGSLTDVLAGMQISLRKPDFDLPELQDLDFEAVLAKKAKHVADVMGTPCLVDDAGVLLDAYPGFPGPLTGNVIRSLGAAGIERLLSGTTDRARMVCQIGCWSHGRLWNWQGEVAGHLYKRRPVEEGPGPLTQWFVPDDGEQTAEAYPLCGTTVVQPSICCTAAEPWLRLGRDIDSLRRHVGEAARR